MLTESSAPSRALSAPCTIKSLSDVQIQVLLFQTGPADIIFENGLSGVSWIVVAIEIANRIIIIVIAVRKIGEGLKSICYNKKNFTIISRFILAK